MKWLVSLLLLLLLVLPTATKAKTEVEYQAEIAQLEAKISSLQSQAQTLSGQIAYYDGQINLAQLKIAQTQEQIASISGKIDSLEGQLQAKSQQLAKQIVHTYKQGGADPVSMLISAENFSQAIQRFKYLQLVQSHNRQFLYAAQRVQTNYAQQKDLIQQSQKRLQIQKNNLDGLRQQRSALLTQTKNNEANYQKLLAQAKAELSALKSFAQWRGGGILPPQPSPDGWYFNQRDERWGRECIGATCGKDPSYVWEVGCVATSVAMIHKKYGQNVTPLTIAKNNSYFFSTTAYMLIPWPSPPGYKYSLYYGKRTDIIDKELAAGRPVVIHLQVNTADGHFLVLKSGSNGDYVMNDPWEGPGLPLKNYYNPNSIISVITYTPA